jgi:hypothetical protein
MITTTPTAHHHLLEIPVSVHCACHRHDEQHHQQASGADTPLNRDRQSAMSQARHNAAAQHLPPPAPLLSQALHCSQHPVHAFLLKPSDLHNTRRSAISQGHHMRPRSTYHPLPPCSRRRSTAPCTPCTPSSSTPPSWTTPGAAPPAAAACRQGWVVCSTGIICRYLFEVLYGY